MANNRTIFLGGCPGAGKTSIAAELARTVAGLVHESAGRLIQRAIDSNAAQYCRPPVASGDEAELMQHRLLVEFQKVRSAHVGTVLLDGHFVVPMMGGSYPVEADVFRSLSIDVFVIVHASPDVIVSRLRARDKQTWWDGDLAQIEARCELENLHAERIARELQRPLIRLSGEGESAARAARAVMG